MMKILKTTVIILLALPAAAGASNTGAAFLKIAPMAESAGMGGAYTALAESINSLYYNPAGISLEGGENIHLGGAHTEWIEGIKYNYAGGIFSLSPGRSIGISATLLTTGKMEGRGPGRERTDDFTASDFALQAAYAASLNSSLSAGASLKAITQRIADDSALGFAAAFGLQKETAGSLKLGVAVRNLGPQMKFLKDGYNLPLTLSAGAGFELGAVTLAFDTDWSVFEDNINLSFGTQWLPMDFLALRGGYLFNLFSSSFRESGIAGEDLSGGISGGLGLNIMQFSLDYAVVPYNGLGTAQRVSFTGRF